MKITGFTFVRNAIKLDYPVTESIRSLLPLCDRVIVAVGKSEDGTLDLIRNMNEEKIQIIETVWNESLKKGGKVLADETNKAFRAVPDDSDWAFYLQADEVVHESYLDTIFSEMQKNIHNKSIDGLLFNYLHFYGSYKYIGDSYRWYRREIRVIRNNKNIYSYKDAQGFRKNNNKKLKVKLIDAYIHHYGWVRKPRAMQEKQKTFNHYWHNDKWLSANIIKADEFDYSNVDALRLYEGSHPSVMSERIARQSWDFIFDTSQKSYSVKEKIKRTIEKFTGWRIGEYKNYKSIS